MHVLRLYMAGLTTENQTAILSFKQHLKDRLGDDYSLEVIDINENPDMADSNKVIATPTLVRELPGPAQKTILDFNNSEKLLLGMELLLKE